MLPLLWRGVKAVAAGRTQANLGLQSPHLPTVIVRVGRFFFSTSGVWIAASWYTGYRNARTEPGSGISLVIPGTGAPVIGTVDRPNRTPKYSTIGSGSGNGSSIVSTPNSSGPGKGNNPFPGATGGRLDQGFDLTGGVFQAPVDSVVIYVSQKEPGWRGGGFVAARVLSGPKQGMVWYYAEGLSPSVVVGQKVRGGDHVATPRPNPYNGINGNIEAGWANPSSPTQPLAQVHSNPASVAFDFYNWIQSLGGPKASSTGNAGHP